MTLARAVIKEVIRMLNDEYYIDPCDPSHYKPRKKEDWTDVFGKPKSNKQRLRELEEEVAELKRRLSSVESNFYNDEHWR